MNSKQLSSLLLSMFLTLAYPFAHAEEGGSNGGGGNELAAHFSDVAVRALTRAQVVSATITVNKKLIKLSTLVAKAKSMKVEVAGANLQLRGSSVAAINYSDLNKVIFDGKRWQKLSLVEKERLAVHEVLGLARIPDANYQVSKMIVTIHDDTCRTHGCDTSRAAKANAVFKYLNDGGGSDDACLNMDDLISLEKINSRTYKIVCGSGPDLYTQIIDVETLNVPDKDGTEDRNGFNLQSFKIRQIEFDSPWAHIDAKGRRTEKQK